MIGFVLVLSLSLLLPTLAGVAAGVRQGDGPAARLAWLLMGGFLVLCGLVIPLNAWLGACWFAWPLALMVAGGAICRLGFSPAGRALKADLLSLNPRWLLPRLLAQALVLGVVAWPAAREGVPAFYDGTTCNDNQQFGTDLITLAQQGYLLPVPLDYAHPLNQLSSTISGYWPISGRVAAQSVGATVATLTGWDPVWTYSGFLASFAVQWSLGTGLLLRTLTPPSLLRGWRGLVADLMLILHPMCLYFIATGNLANAFGVVVATLVWLLLRQAQKEGFTRQTFWMLPLSVFALAGVYPELVPFTGLAGLMVLVSEWFRNRPALGTGRWWLPVAVATVGLFVFPPTFIRTVSTVRVALAESASASDPARQSILPPNLFAELHKSAFVPCFASMATALPAKLTTLPMMIITVALSLCWFVGLYVTRDRPFAWGWAVAFDLAAILVARSGYGYGWQKISQYHSTILAVLAILGSLWLLPPPGNRARWRMAGYLPGLLVSGWLLLSFGRHAVTLFQMSFGKCVTAEHQALEDFCRQRDLEGKPLAEPIMVEDQTIPFYPAAYFQSVWLPHFLPGKNLVYDDAGTGGGYLNLITNKVSSLPWPPPVHLAYRHTLVEHGGSELFTTTNFHLIENPVIARVQGLHQEERQVTRDQIVTPWGTDPPGSRRFAWMAEAVRLWVEAPTAGQVVLEVGDRFDPLAPSPFLTVECPAGTRSVSLDNPDDGPNCLKIPVPAGRCTVTLRSPNGAISPQEASLSGDGRKLSYKILSIRFEP